MTVRAHATVPDDAIAVAADRVARMLRPLPAAVLTRLRRARRLGAHHRLAASDERPARAAPPAVGARAPEEEAAIEGRRRAELRRIGRADDLGPRRVVPHATIDERTRGMGGLEASCGEENLLAPDDEPKYTGRDILTHELAHTLMDYGLRPELRAAIEACHREAVEERGLWMRPDGSKAYAATNAQEYFAELSMWIHGGRGEFVDAKRSLPAAGPYGLASYDRAGFDLLGAIYSGSHPLQRSDEVEPPPLALNATSAAATSADVGGDERVLELANEAEGGDELRIAWVDANGTAHDYGSGRRRRDGGAAHVCRPRVGALERARRDAEVSSERARGVEGGVERIRAARASSRRRAEGAGRRTSPPCAPSVRAPSARAQWTPAPSPRSASRPSVRRAHSHR